MDISRSSSPEAPPQDLWSSILDSVSKSRTIPAKQVLVLGQPSSGKSSIVSALLQKPKSDATNEEQRSDFAVGYDWADVRDDADEGPTNIFFLSVIASRTELGAPMATAIGNALLSLPRREVRCR